MHKVKRMTQTPIACLYCGRGNIADDPDTMDTMWFLDLERDVNWGDSTYLCKYCCLQIGVTAGLVTEQDLKETQDVVRAQARKIHNLQASLDLKQRRLDNVTGAARAVKKEKKERRQRTGETVEELKTRTKKRKDAA